jgi:tripartite-type tricarboxylate transporter receptor subunit TctC
MENRPAPPAGTPEPVVRQLNEAVSAGLRAPAARERLDGQGMDVITDRPDGTAAVLRTEIAKWGKAIRDAGAEVD